MYFTKSRSPIVNTYTMNGVSIDMVTTKKDLAVIFCSDLNVHTHIESIYCRAFKILGFVIRTSKNFKRTSSLKMLYCSLVRSLLEYASVIWDPYTTTDSSHLEIIYKIISKIIIRYSIILTEVPIILYNMN